MTATYPTSGTTVFNLDFTQICEEAYERCGAESRSGYDLRTARRSLNLLLQEFANKGINLWTVDGPYSVTLTPGVATYYLPADTVDLLDHVIRTNVGDAYNQNDLSITRISESTYITIPNKMAPGRPIQVWINRQSGANDTLYANSLPSFTVWPTPDSSMVYTFVYYRLRRIQDVGNGDNGLDLPFRFLPCVVAGLAYYLSFKIPDALPRMEVLKAVYNELLMEATAEDREKAAIRLVPRQSFTR